MTRFLALIKKVAPWAVAAAILWFLFDRVPLGDAWSAATEARLLEFALATAIAVTAWWLIESRAFAFLFTRFNAPLSWREARSLRGLTYLVTPINWNLGTAAIVLHLRRSKGIGAMASTSTMAFYGIVDLLVLSGLALAGASTMPASPAIATVQRAAAIALCLAIANLVVFMTSWPHWRWLARVRGAGLFASYRAATPRDLALLVAARTCYFAGFVLFFWFGTRAFHTAVPLAFAMAATPIILVVAALPITPAGLGTQQATMLYLFDPYGTEAAILAFSLAYPVALILGRLPLGLLYLRDLAGLRNSLRETGNG